MTCHCMACAVPCVVILVRCFVHVLACCPRFNLVSGHPGACSSGPCDAASLPRWVASSSPAETAITAKAPGSCSRDEHADEPHGPCEERSLRAWSRLTLLVVRRCGLGTEMFPVSVDGAEASPVPADAGTCVQVIF